jgi:hypothetical protein
MFCRNFCGDIAARNDGKPGTKRVSQNGSDPDKVYILPSYRQARPAQQESNTRMGEATPTHVGGS